MISRMFPPPGMLAPPGAGTATSDPAHWHPQYDEPVYAEVYREHRDRLLAGLADGRGEVVTP